MFKRSFTLKTYLIGMAVGVFGLSLFSQDPSVSADPADDLSFSLADEQRHHRSVMKPKQVERVFTDRLVGSPVSQTRQLANEFVSLCHRYRFDPAFILALVQVESGFKVRAVSPAGAVGLFQIMPDTARFVSRMTGIPYRDRADLFNPMTNLRLGMAYLAYLRNLFPDRSHFFLLAAYNMGPAALKKKLSQNSFRPVQTLRYYWLIRRAVPEFRYYSVSGKKYVRAFG